jgi:glutamate-ammonia-ligase adenylyltransferase
MEIATLVNVLDHPHVAADRLQGWGLRDVRRGHRLLLELIEAGLTLDLLAAVCNQLERHLSQTRDPDGALDGFVKFFLAVRSPLALASLLLRDATAMPMLLAALSLGPRWAEMLREDPEAFDLLRLTEGEPVESATLLGDIRAELALLADERSLIAALSRIHQRQLLRIAYGEVAGGLDLKVTLQQLTILAESLIKAAWEAAQRMVSDGRGPRAARNHAHQTCTVLALGQLGGGDGDYSGSMELLVAYEAQPADAATLHDHFNSAAKFLARVLTTAGSDTKSLSVRLIALPDAEPVAAHAADDVINGFDSFGRTWHRQALLKARPVAGDWQFGEAIVKRLEAWMFRRYLNAADETGIRALKRRILMEARLHQDDWTNVRLARGGLRDLEATVEFLELLVGGEQLAVRRATTLDVLDGLAKAGAITAAEYQELTEGYKFFRRLLHALQVSCGPQQERLPEDEMLVTRIASQIDPKLSSDAVIAQFQERQLRIWQILQKLLESAFPEDPSPPREVELLLDPTPTTEEVRAALAPFGFAMPPEALAMLNDLASEQVPFLSTRRCRHLLAAILPQLLCAVGATPDPDRTLTNMVRVGNSLGGKGVLWQLFGVNPPLLQLYVRLCAASPYLSGILTTNPGMIDELVDSLQLHALPSRSELQATFDALCRGAADTVPILHDFKNAQHLRIGVRDIVGREDVDLTHEALADVAEICLAHVVDIEYERLVEKFGTPTIGLSPLEGQKCRHAVLGLGKLGGRDPNYHSELDLLFLYEAEGTTRPATRSRRDQRTANNHFFTQLAQRVANELSQLTPCGRLYVTNPQLRPIGIGGAMALSLDDFSGHFSTGAAPLWHWQALCEARAVVGETELRDNVDRLIRRLLIERQAELDRDELVTSRLQLEKGASPHNLKRAGGGTLDVEFLVQWLQLENASASPDVLTTNMQAALIALAAAGALSTVDAQSLGDSYRFLRRVESGLRLLNATARHDLPASSLEIAQLALLLGHGNPDRLRQQCLEHMAQNRATFDRLLAVVAR